MDFFGICKNYFYYFSKHAVEAAESTVLEPGPLETRWRWCARENSFEPTLTRTVRSAHLFPDGSTCMQLTSVSRAECVRSPLHSQWKAGFSLLHFSDWNILCNFTIFKLFVDCKFVWIKLPKKHYYCLFIGVIFLIAIINLT